MFMYSDNSIATALNDYGHSYTALSDLNVAVPGAETDDFLDTTMQQTVAQMLIANPQIKAVHLSIGGNDMLGSWQDTLSADSTNTMLNDVMARGQEIINFLRSVRPDIIVLFSGYCYPNFAEPIETYPGGSTQHPYYSAWQKMNFPTFLEINSILDSFSNKMVAACDTLPYVKYYPAMSLMQYMYGQTTPLGVAPGGTYPQYSQSIPFGDPNYPSPKNAMLNEIISQDCFHLSPQGYQYLLDYHTRKFYQKFLMDDLYVLADSAQSGSVSALGQTSTDVKVGDTGSDLYNAVLSFNTSAMADTTLQRASIFLHRETSNGPNPVNENLTIRIKHGNFGATVSVDSLDYTAMGDASDHPCVAGANTNGYWARLDLPNSLLTYITKDTLPTQFIISTPYTSGNRVQFSNSSDPEYAPILNLKYGQPIVPTGISELEKDNVRIYPNPTNGLLNIETNNLNVQQVQVTDITGKIMLVEKATRSLDISGLSSGMYVVSLSTNEGTVSKKIVKE